MNDVASVLKRIASGLGKLVKRVDDTPDGVEVYGVNGRTVYLDAETSGGRAVSIRAYESGGDEIRHVARAVRTDRPGWEREISAALKGLLGGRVAAVAESLVGRLVG